MLPIYKEKLENIKNEVLAVGHRVVLANELSLESIQKGNYEQFNDAKTNLQNLDKASNKIDNMIVNTLALHAPEAKDLRVLVSYLKITNELVRASTNTKSFIKSFAKVVNFKIDMNSITEYSIPLHKSAITALKTALEIIEREEDNKTEEYYLKVMVSETKTDDLYSMIEKNVLKLASKDIEHSKEYFEVLSSLRRLEKVADRAASIANLLLYAHIGGEIHQA